MIERVRGVLDLLGDPECPIKLSDGEVDRLRRAEAAGALFSGAHKSPKLCGPDLVEHWPVPSTRF